MFNILTNHKGKEYEKNVCLPESCAAQQKLTPYCETNCTSILFKKKKTRFGSQKAKELVTPDPTDEKLEPQAVAEHPSSYLKPRWMPPRSWQTGSSGGEGPVSEGGALPSMTADQQRRQREREREEGSLILETQMPKAVTSEATRKLDTLLDPKIILSEASHRKTSMWYHFHVEVLKMVPMNLFTHRVTDTENKGKDRGEG